MRANTLLAKQSSAPYLTPNKYTTEFSQALFESSIAVTTVLASSRRSYVFVGLHGQTPFEAPEKRRRPHVSCFAVMSEQPLDNYVEYIMNTIASLTHIGLHAPITLQSLLFVYHLPSCPAQPIFKIHPFLSLTLRHQSLVQHSKCVSLPSPLSSPYLPARPSLVSVYASIQLHLKSGVIFAE